MNIPFSPAVLVAIDYDGVLQTSALPDFIDFEFLPRFESVLRDFPTAGVLISSTHRYGFSLDTLRQLYSPDIRPRVIGATPDLAVGRAEGGRYLEIQSFVSNQFSSSLPWIALDDEAHLFPANCSNLLLTNRFWGLTEEIEAKLRDWLLKHS